MNSRFRVDSSERPSNSQHGHEKHIDMERPDAQGCNRPGGCECTAAEKADVLAYLTQLKP